MAFLKKKKKSKYKPIKCLGKVLKPVKAAPGFLVSDVYRDWVGGRGVGRAICGAPPEMGMVLDFTGLRGSAPNIYYSLIYQAPKWGYHVRKVDEYIDVNPTMAEYYNITLAQKQKLEASIKQGLASAAQAVADYELLEHDYRRYREILDYFVKSHTEKDEHVLRSLFVDRVDAHTGEMYSLLTMTKRWPTIITDFIRMRGEWKDRDEIKKKLDVSEAEVTVLMTKNQLYNEWKKLFLPTIKERVARLKVMLESRKKSVDEYRSWLKPYVAKFKSMREPSESAPSAFVSNAYMTPGLGQSQAAMGIRLWLWKPYNPPSKRKPEAMPSDKQGGFILDPYDEVVKKWKKIIEIAYDVKIPDKKVRKILKSAVKEPRPTFNTEMNANTLYYILFDVTIDISLLRTPPPEGFESDNMMFFPLKTLVMSQNSLLIHLLELHARDMAFENNINVMIGSKEAEKGALEDIEKEFDPVEVRNDKFKRLKDTKESFVDKLKFPLESFFYLFFRRGPYEPIFEERVTKTYFRGAGAYYGQMKDFIMQRMQVE